LSQSVSHSNKPIQADSQLRGLVCVIPLRFISHKPNHAIVSPLIATLCVIKTMTKDEIKSHCSVGYDGSVCIYRKRVKKAQFVVQSIYICGGVDEGYEVQVEFDPMSMIEEGEGLRYRSEAESLDKIVDSLEEFISLPINDWENFTKSGNAPFYDSEEITSEHYQSSWAALTARYNDGRSLLPKGLVFK